MASRVGITRGAAALLCGTVLASAAIAQPARTDAVQSIGSDVSPLYGRINPFYGDVNSAYGRINPFYGRINPFYGRINPFWGDVNAFWGRINPFTQATDASTTTIYGAGYDPFWGANSPYKPTKDSVDYKSLSGFWSSQFTAWTPVLDAWNSAQTSADAQAVAGQLQKKVVKPMTDFWKPVLDKAGQKGATPVVDALAAAGVVFKRDGSIDPASLLTGDPSSRAMMFLNLYDKLMDNAGTGHVDWWMGATGWTPALAYTQGVAPVGGVTPTIGMIDFVISDGTHKSNQVTQYGSSVFADGHGAAVGSLILGGTDNSGVMGVMPQGSGKVVVYDPYDDTGTTNWTDVGTGVRTLSNLIVEGRPVPMGVINASLGVPGWTLHPGWNDALAGAGAHDRNLVVAAGNDGVTQTDDVAWDFQANPTLLVVGSVGADGTISNFSNRPGEACLLPTGTSVCQEANKLKYRFVVAPGELILVSDGQGGHLRVSGTSLAAPLVSGAIGLLQNRWPWLSNYPNETASIILRSATPKGDNPGADPVYGAGQLNIAASQAPLDWSKLVFYRGNNGLFLPVPLSLATVTAQMRGGLQATWNTTGLAYSAFETIGNTHRDFQIPLASRLVGQTVTTQAGGQAYQAYLSTALRAQAGYFAALGGESATPGAPLAGFAGRTLPAGRIGSAQLRVSLAPAELNNAFRMASNRYDTDAVLVSPAGSLRFGFGNAAPALDGSAGFAFRSDYDVSRGGANPLLGLASGGGYLGGRANVGHGVAVTFGTTDRSTRRNLSGLVAGPAAAGRWFDRYAAQAQTVGLAWTPSARLGVRASYTRLHEDAALLGIQSLAADDLAGGATTEGATLAFDYGVTRTLTLSGTATTTRSRAVGGQITTRDLTGFSAAMALTKSRIFASRDQLRLTLASPLHNVGGSLSYGSVGVVDRQTGAIGIVGQSFRPRGTTPLAGEASYGMGLPGGRGVFSLFGRADRAGQISTGMGYAGGAQLRFAL